MSDNQHSFQILALHGQWCNAEFFLDQIEGSYLNEFFHAEQFHIPDAPLLATAEEIGTVVPPPVRAFFKKPERYGAELLEELNQNTAPDSFQGYRRWCGWNESTQEYEGLEKTLEFLAAYLEQKKAQGVVFDGVLGFSQGAMLGLYLAAIVDEAEVEHLSGTEQRIREVLKPMKFVLHASGMAPRGEQMRREKGWFCDEGKKHNTRSKIRMLFLSNGDDFIVPAERTAAASKFFELVESVLFEQGITSKGERFGHVLSGEGGGNSEFHEVAREAIKKTVLGGRTA